MRSLLRYLACCVILSLGLGCIAVPGPQEECPCAASHATPAGVFLVDAEASGNACG